MLKEIIEMIHFFVRIFIKDYENIKSPTVREAYGRLGSIIGIICNILLSSSKIIAGILFSSLSMVADGINNLSDMGSLIISLIGFKLSAKPADDDHPFGHARFEYISSLIISFIIIWLGLQLIITSFKKIFNPNPIEVNMIMLIILVASIIIKLWLSYINKSLGEKISSPSMKATSSDSLSDALATSGVLISVLIYRFVKINIDAYVGLAVALFIIYSGLKILKDMTNELVGIAPDHKFVVSIYEKILSYEGVLGLHDLVVHSYGPNRCFASVHVEVSYKEDILKSHDLIDKIEKDFSLEQGIHLVIHLDPIIVGDPLTDQLHLLVSNIISQIDPKLSIHDFRAVVGSTYKNLIFDITVPHSLKISDQELIKQINQMLTKEDPSFTAIVTIDRSYTYVQSQKYQS